jgi:hypothetical protein
MFRPRRGGAGGTPGSGRSSRERRPWREPPDLPCPEFLGRMAPEARSFRKPRDMNASPRLRNTNPFLRSRSRNRRLRLRPARFWFCRRAHDTAASRTAKGLNCQLLLRPMLRLPGRPRASNCQLLLRPMLRPEDSGRGKPEVHATGCCFRLLRLGLGALLPGPGRWSFADRLCL